MGRDDYPLSKDESGLKRQATVLAVGWLMTWLALYTYALPVRILLKNRLHLDATAVAGFTFLASFAWNVKPIAGLVSDSFPLFGTRRRHYLLGASLLGAASWIILGVVPQTYHNLLLWLVVMNTAIMVCSTVLGGVLVEAGKRYGATGRLTGHRTAIMNVCVFVAGPLGGYLASRAFGLTAAVCAVMMFCLFPFAWLLLREPRNSQRDTHVWLNAGRQLKSLVKSKPLWAAVLMNILFYIAPGFTTPLLFYQTNTLHFSEQFIGNLAVWSGAFGILGALVYVRLCRRISLRVTMYAAVICSGVGSLLYALYYSRIDAIIIESTNGLMTAVATLALFDLSARAAPKGCEAMAYSVMMAAGNLSIGLSDVFGSAMHDKLHWSFMNLVWFNGGTTFLILFVVPFLPRMLMERRDGDVLESAELQEEQLAMEAV